MEEWPSESGDTVLLTALRIDSNGLRTQARKSCRLHLFTVSAVIVQLQKHVIAKQMLIAAWYITRTNHQIYHYWPIEHRSCASTIKIESNSPERCFLANVWQGNLMHQVQIEEDNTLTTNKAESWFTRTAKHSTFCLMLVTFTTASNQSLWPC